MKKKISEDIKLVVGLAPAANCLAGTKITDVVNLGLYRTVAFVLHRGTGTTGTQTITVQASAANDGASPTAIPFKYRRMVASGDTLGAVTDATAAGFTTVAGGDDVYIIEVEGADLPDGKPWVHLKSVEVVAQPVQASCLILLGDGRYTGLSMPSAI